MSGLKKLYKNAALLAIADTTARGATGIIAILIARFYGPELYGQYATAAATGGLFMLLTGSGFEREFTRIGSLNPSNIAHAFRLNLYALILASIIAYSGLFIFFFSSSFSESTITLGVVMGIALILTRFSQPFRFLFILLEKTHVTALIQLASTCTLFVVTLFVIAIDGSILSIVYFHALVALFVFGFWLKSLPNDFGRLTPPSLPEIRTFAIGSIPFVFSNVVWIAYFNFDVFMLSLMHDEETVGLYASVFRILSLSFIFGSALTHTFTPLLFASYKDSKENFKKKAIQLLSSLWILGTLMWAIFFIGGEWLVGLILGGDYAEGVILAKTLSFALLLRIYSFGLTELLTTSNRQRLRLILEGTLLGVNILFNFLLIPTLGGVGAALSSVIAEVVLFSGALFFCLRYNLIFSKKH